MRGTALITILALAALVGSPAAAEAKGVVIVNASNPASEMDRRKIKKFYLKQRHSWESGSKVQSTDVKGDPAYRGDFLEKVLRMSSEALKRYWIQKQYQNATSPSKELDDAASVVRFVSDSKGGIGFVDAAAAKGAPGVKVIFTY